jgi:hypothetical protein
MAELCDGTGYSKNAINKREDEKCGSKKNQKKSEKNQEKNQEKIIR